MAQTVLFPAYANRPSLNVMTPNSPDPTPLRMLAFSVAEAALQSNPNSPLFAGPAKVPSPPKVRLGSIGVENVNWATSEEGRVPTPLGRPMNVEWANGSDAKRGDAAGQGLAQRRGKELWTVIERAKERKSNASFIDEASSGPLSPSYSFVLPPNSPLAESVAAEARAVSTPPKQKHSALLSSLDRVPRRSTPLFTRSAEPSPTYSTFSGLDQSQPPPEFVPRLSAQEFSAKSSRIAQSTKARHARTQSDADSPDLVSPIEAVFPTANTRLPSRLPNRQAQRLPSLQQIQAKMTGGHRRTGSAGSMPAMEKQTTELRLDVTMVSASGSSIIATQPRPCGTRTDSEDSLEVIRTPDDEMPSPLRERRLALQAIMNRRPPTPPSPSGGKERLLPFLRERTSDRLASVKKEMVEQATGQSIPCTPPNASTTTSRPVLRVTPPSFESRPAVPPLVLAPKAVLAARSSSGSGFFNARSRHVSSPTELRFTPPARLSTPPARAFSGSYSHTQAYGSGSGPGTPISPATSVRSLAPSCSSGSPTMNMPIITCTPAPPVVLRDGVEQDSDDGSEPDVIVFDGEAEEREREERERRGSEMRAKLGLRRRSID